MYLPEAVQEVMCAHLLLHELARLAGVSKLWAAIYEARLSSEQQRLKALAAEAPLVPSSTASAPRRPLLDPVPSHLPPSPNPADQGQGRWQPFAKEPEADQPTPEFMGVWRPDGMHLASFCLSPAGEIRVRGFMFGIHKHCFIVAYHAGLEADGFLMVPVAAGKPEDMPQLLGLVLVLIQDRLPRMLAEQRQRSGGPARALNIFLRSTLFFGSS